MRKRILAVIVALLMIVTLLPVTAFAVDKTNSDGIKVTQTTNKQNYSAGENIIVNVIVTNSAGYDIKNLKIVNSIPSGYKLVAAKTEETTIDLLKAGNTSEQFKTEYMPEVVEKEEIVQTADGSHQDVLLYLVIAVICITMILMLNKSSKINQRVITMSLCCLLAVALFVNSGVIAVGEENPDNTITVSSKVMVEDEEVEVITTVTFEKVTTPTQYEIKAITEPNDPKLSPPYGDVVVTVDGVNVETAEAGKTVTIKVIPNEGYELLEWKVSDNVVIDETKLTNPDTNEISFVMPAGNVEVTAIIRMEGCLAAGTPITLVNGETKLIENLSRGDMVKVFNHETGKVDSAKLFDVWKYPEQRTGALTLHFSNGSDVTVVGGHCFFNKDLNKYVDINKANVNGYIGHSFYNLDLEQWVTLEGVDFVKEAVDTYIIVTEKHFNCVANGMLSSEDGFYEMIINAFEYGEGLKVDQAKKAADIEKYGLWSANNLEYLPIEAYDALNLQYMNVLFGKGVVSPETASWLGAYSVEIDPELFCN